MRDKSIMIGAGGHAKCLIDILLRQDEYELVGIIGREDEQIDELLGFPVFKGDAYLQEFWNQGVRNISIGIGGYRNNSNRKNIYLKLKALGFQLINLVDPTAVIAKGVTLGDGVVIFPGVFTNPDVRIGSNVVIYHGSAICHDSVVNDHVLISAGVTIGASCSIGEGTLFALGSTTVSGIRIGADILVAAGAVVTCDILEPGTYLGIPAKLRQP